MKSTVIIFKHFISDASGALLYLAALSVLLTALPLKHQADGVLIAGAALLPLFVVFRRLKSFRRAVAAGVCCFAATLVLYGFTERYFSLLFCVLFAAFSVFALKGEKTEVRIAALFLIGTLAAVCAGLSYPFCLTVLKKAAYLVKGRGALFGTAASLYDFAVSPTLRGLFEHTSYALSALRDGKIVSGACAFPHSREAALYLAGKYFVSIPLTVGIAAALLPKMKGRNAASLIAVSASAMISGDTRLFALFLFLYNPVLLFAWLFGCFFAYLLPSLLDLRIGYKVSGALWELFQYGNRWGYVLAVAAVLALLTYFLSRLVLARFEIYRCRWLPKAVRSLTDALGGAENLERLEGNRLTVRNPNLIDILKLDCDIHQNSVTLFEEDAALLSDYFFTD